MFTSNRKKIVVLLLAVIMLVSSQAAVGIESTPNMNAAVLSRDGGIDWVALYLEERGLTRDDLNTQAQAGAPAAATTPAQGTQTAPTAPRVPNPPVNAGGFVPSTRFPHANMRSSIQSHAAVHNEVVGWIVVPGTNINFPVNLNTTNNSHYLYRDWRGNDFTGRLNWTNWAQFPDTATYLDFRTRIGPNWGASSRNIPVYGHNWTNLRPPYRVGNHAQDRMFAQLKSYMDINFATQNPHIYFSTGDMEGIWRVFAVGYIHTTPFFFYNSPNPTREGAQNIIDEWRHRTHFNFNVDVNADDRLLTLTTCTRFHGNMLTQRYIVVARLLRPGESENDVVTATRNQNIRHPDFSLPVRLPPSAIAPAAPATTTP